ncbi:MAG TPA: NapC/NirT family cytochrome c [Verrucomicrobiae bacterium]|nr:NapC/NirT family cytochrome c [Verrucomicrobiae bacterium]
MNIENKNEPTHPPSVFRNWLSWAGFIVGLGALFSFLLLFMLDAVAHFSSPYIGILTFCIVPAFLISGIGLAIAGAWLERRKRQRGNISVPRMQIDLSDARDRKRLGIFVIGSFVFIMLSAVGSYNAFEITESVPFCGETCHTVMKPELTTHDHGPHARVACVACHVGPGASWFVRSKITGSYQLYAVAFHKYPTPIPTPIKNLRPARETCEQCHWPKSFVGNLDRTYDYFQDDVSNTPYSIRLLLKVGAGDPEEAGTAPPGGIHWHILSGNTVEYIATDAARQNIPWVRLTDAQGTVTVFRAPRFTNDISHYEIRKMDCMDCHNRPAHRYQPPEFAVNHALAERRIDPTLPWIKTNAVYVLTRPYTTEEEARTGIATGLSERYPNDARIKPAIAVVQQIYSDNFFPEMKADWSKYPDNIGHMIWPGCFRCHDGLHKTDDGRRTIKADDCNSCHTILAQGSGADLLKMTTGGQQFNHTGGDYDLGCSACHTGGP